MQGYMKLELARHNQNMQSLTEEIKGMAKQQIIVFNMNGEDHQSPGEQQQPNNKLG